MFAHQRDQYRYELRKASTKAVAEAMRRGAKDLPDGAIRRRVVSQARRLHLCSLTQYGRTVTTDQGVCFRASNKRECRHRLCPQGEAVRTRELRAHVRALLTKVWELSPEARALFVTLSTPNRMITDVGAMYEAHDKALQRFFKLKRITAATLGHFTAFEVAVRGTDDAPEAGVHTHSLVMVPPSYFKDRTWLTQEEWCRLWNQANRTQGLILDVRTVKSSQGATDHAAVLSSAVELTKYVIKAGNFFQHRSGRIQVNDQVAVALAIGLHRRRIVRFDRIFKKVADALRKS